MSLSEFVMFLLIEFNMTLLIVGYGVLFKKIQANAKRIEEVKNIPLHIEY